MPTDGRPLLSRPRYFAIACLVAVDHSQPRPGIRLRDHPRTHKLINVLITNNASADGDKLSKVLHKLDERSSSSLTRDQHAGKLDQICRGRGGFCG